VFKYGKKKPQGATRNLGRQAQPAASSRSALPGWLLVGLGMSIGLFLAFMLYLWKPWQPVKREIAQPSVAVSDTPPAETKSAEPRFDFYRLLPSQKVVPNEPPPEVTPPVTPKPAVKTDPAAKPAAVNDARKREADKQRAEAILEGKKVPAPEKPKPDSTVKDKPKEKEKDKEADSGKFSLQAGSFKSQAEAERRKAKVALQGLPARVQQVTVKEGQVWYRVIVGPFKGKTASDKAQGELRGGGIDSLMVKEKK
jgi:cell division protein FtsN